jgi:integrase
MPDRYRAMVLVGAGTGLRPGEFFGLQVADLNLLRRTLTVERQVQQDPTGAVAPCRLKTRASYRTVPLASVVVDMLAAHLAAYPATGADYVFRDDAGRPIGRTRFGEVWRAARVRAGVPDATPHGLRHFYASALIRAGLSVKVVSDRLGHSNAAETLNTYSHMWPDDADRSRQAIEDVFRPKIQPDVPYVRPKKRSS